MYYTTKELAQLMRVDPKTIKRWAVAGKLQYKKIGRKYVFPKEGYDRKTI